MNIESQSKSQRNSLGIPALLLLSYFSCVWLCATPSTAAHQAPLSLGFSRQEHWSSWVAISFSNAWMWKVKVKSLSHVWLLATPWTAAYQAPPSMAFSRQEYWSGVPLPSPLRIPKAPQSDSLDFTCLLHFVSLLSFAPGAWPALRAFKQTNVNITGQCLFSIPSFWASALHDTP